MEEILLDRDGTRGVPEGYLVVETEVEFLQKAMEPVPLLVRGSRLCDWAAAFYRARRIAFKELVSIRHRLQELAPQLSDEQASALAQRLGAFGEEAAQSLTPQSILHHLFPSPLWSGAPSVAHGAEWLLWLQQTTVEAYLTPLLAQLTKLWQRAADPAAQPLYSALSPDEAHKHLDNWLGIGERPAFPIPTQFPLLVPASLTERARHAWRRRAIESHGQFFDELERQAIPFSLKQLAAREVANYFRDKPQELTPGRLKTLAHYLSQTDYTHLQRLLPPASPGHVPIEPSAVLRWFREEYLPYREWQHSHAPVDAQGRVVQSAKEFAEWYLNHYPQALAGASPAKWLTFNKAAELSRRGEGVTLIVVLDGLHAADARLLLQGIRQHASRLEVLSDGLAFAPLPTITEFAKEALIRGAPPGQIEAVLPIGEVLPEDKSPAAKLAAAQRGGVYLWRVLEPDRTYHFRNRFENLQQDIEGRLEAEARKIQEIVEAVPGEIVLQIVVTTDHGRLLGRAERTRPIPDGMRGHGRAAWGETSEAFPAEGYVVRDGVAYLYGDRFGLNTDVAIPLDESSFVGNDGRAGSEAYPHGGLFPEEVIVPWITLLRDQTPPQLEITITGSGRARRSGVLQVKVMNMGEVIVELRAATLQFGRETIQEVPLGFTIGQRAQVEWQLALEPWPSAAEARSASASVQCLPPTHTAFEVAATVRLQSEDLYVAPDNILEDLD